MTHEIIKELEAKLAGLTQKAQRLKETITFLRSLGYGERKEDPPPPIVRPREIAATPTKGKRGQFTAKLKAAIESLGGKTFTIDELRLLLPQTPEKKHLSTRLGQLAHAGYLTRKPTVSGKVYERARPDKPISQFSQTQKEKARAALDKHGFHKFICEGCGQSFELCPHRCPKCSGRAFEELELGKGG